MLSGKSSSSHTLEVGSDSEFFVAICKKINDVHSFLVLGVHDKASNKNYVLCSVGKVYNPNSSLVTCSVFTDFFFHRMDGTLKTEFKPKSTSEEIKSWEVTYKAYRIDRSQYLNFITELSRSNRFLLGNGFRAYQLKSKTDDTGNLEFEFGLIGGDGKTTRSQQFIDASASQLHINNSCRHTALNLFETIFLGKFFDIDLIANHFSFLKPFPNQCHIVSRDGNIQMKNFGSEKFHPIFIFPTPPFVAPSERKLKEKILLRIYRQLHKVSQVYLDNPVTYQKFDAMKELYATINSCDGSGLADIAEQWEMKYEKLIGEHRGFSLFGRTATCAMLNELKVMASKAPAIKFNR